MPTDARDGGPGADRSRGQTSVDLVVGLTLFIVTITVVLGQLPTLLGPAQPQATSAVADRAADELYGELVVRNATTSPATLDEPCVVAFFEGAGGAGCQFDPSKPVNDRLGISSLYAVNITFAHGNGSSELEPYCHNASEVVVCGTDTLEVGPPVPSDASVGVAYRGVRVPEKHGVIVVRVWRR